MEEIVFAFAPALRLCVSSSLRFKFDKMETEEKPPVFKSWIGWYWLLMSVLVAQIIIYLMITRSFA